MSLRHPLRGVQGLKNDLVQMMMGGGSDQRVIPHFGGNTGPTQKQVYSGMRQGVASLSGADAIANFHDNPGLKSGIGLAMAVPMSPAGRATLATKLSELKKTGYMAHKMGDTGLTMRTVHALDDKGFPAFTHTGVPYKVGDRKMSQDMMPGDARHYIALVKNEKAHLPAHKLTHEDVAGFSDTGSSQDLNHGFYHEGFIKKEHRGKGLYGDMLDTRAAQVQHGLGNDHTIPIIGGSFSPDAAPSVIGQWGRNKVQLNHTAVENLLVGQMAGLNELRDYSPATEKLMVAIANAADRMHTKLYRNAPGSRPAHQPVTGPDKAELLALLKQANKLTFKTRSFGH